MRVLMSTFGSRGDVDPVAALAPQATDRAKALAGRMRTDGAAMAASLLLRAAA